MDEEAGKIITRLVAKQVLLEQLVAIMLKDKFRDMNYTRKDVVLYAEEVKRFTLSKLPDIPESDDNFNARELHKSIVMEIDDFFALVRKGFES